MLLCTAAPAIGAPTLRVQVDQRGDFLLVGNTLGYDCGNSSPAPVVGTVSCVGSISNADSAPDVHWRSESPGAGQAEANVTVFSTQARSTSILTIPAGATVTHAFLYWGALGNGGADTQVTFDRPSGFSQTINGVAVGTSGNSYQSVADVTSIIQANGSGAYRVSGVEANSFIDDNDNNLFAGWYLVVFYQLNTEPPRNLSLFDGFDTVTNNNAQNATLSGFVVPTAGFDAKLGVVTFEGDSTLTGDQLLFDGVALSDAVNGQNNFFNGSRSFLGAPVSVAGDLPQLTGGANSMGGVDIDVVDITPQLVAGQTSAPISATSSGDVYHLAAWITSISTFLPDFTTSTKTAVDLNGGDLVTGDVIEYTITITNTGNDTAIDVILDDAIPTGTTYVPGSIEILSGPNAGAKTDAPGDDQAEFDGMGLVVRLGTGATAFAGGDLGIGESTSLKFRVTVTATSGTISNQAEISAAGLQGGPPGTWNTGTPGNPGAPTTNDIDECTTDADCAAPTPACDTTADPKICVECTNDSYCSGLSPNCDLGTNTCVCTGGGAETCDGDDNDCNGTIDDGFGTGVACTAGVGACEATGVIVCTSPSTTGCNATPGQPSQEMCNDAIDSDCDGDPNNGCGGTDTDEDGLPDDVETMIGTNPNDADSDDDGVPDGQEPSVGVDTDNDGLINGLDPDSDNDGLYDGTELGLDCSAPGTDAAAGHCVEDADPTTTTNPLDADTDDGGVPDGNEDLNLDGAIDAGETDPNDPKDDVPPADTDGDGLPDDLETAIGTDPEDADSDDDGVIDGDEPNFADDTDRDGAINALDPDSDDDGLFDGTELGLPCGLEATDPNANNCIPDADNGASTTSALDPDTDDGGVSDGDEDTNHNGTIDAGETDPNDPSDDMPGTGGGGQGGSGPGGGGTGGTAPSGGGGAGGGIDEGIIPQGGGCSCTTASGPTNELAGLGLAAAALLFGTRRRRR